MLTFTAINLSHANICAQLDSLCFDSEVFDLTMIQSLLSTPYVSGCLAMEKEDAIGYALFSHSGDEGDLLTISILPNKRDQGYGKQLLMEVFKMATTKKIEKLFLEVRVSNQAAIQLYQNHGGKTIGRRANYYSIAHSTQKEDALVMELPIKI